MSVLDQKKVERIKQQLKAHPRGMTITDLAMKVRMNRNLMAKYLDMLLISGQVEKQTIGPAKLYHLSDRVPVSAMMSFSSDFVIMLDSERRILQVNEPFLTLLSVRRDALVGKTMAETGFPFLAKIPVHHVSEGRHAPAAKDETISGEFPGGKRHFRVRQVPTAFEDGSQGITLILEDITDRIRYQELLEVSEARYRGIVEDQTEFVTRFLPDGTLTFANRSICSFVGLPQDGLLGKSFLDMIPAEDKDSVIKTLQSLDRENNIAMVEHRVTGISGRTCWIQWTNRALFSEDGSIREFQGVGRDITEKKEAEIETRRHAADMAFLSRMAWEFVELPRDADIYEVIGKGMQELVPHAMLSVNTYDPRTQRFTVRTILPPEDRDVVKNLAGSDVVGMQMPIDTDAPAILLPGRLLEIPGDFYQVTFHQIPEDASRQITGKLDITGYYAIGMVSQGILFGDIPLFMKGGAVPENTGLIETYVRQASIALQRRLAEEALKEQEQEAIRNMEFLNRTAMAFVEMGDSDEIFQYIADQLHAIVPGSTVAVNSYDPSTRLITTRSLGGEREVTDALRYDLIPDLIGQSFVIDLIPFSEPDFLKNRLMEGPPLYDLLFHMVPEEKCTRFEEQYNLGKNYAKGFVCRGGVFGNVSINIRRGEELKNRETIEAFVSQAAVALLRRHARREVREKEKQSITNLEFLSNTAMAFVEMGDDEDIYQFIADRIFALAPDSMVSVQSFDPASRNMMLRAVKGSEADTACLFRELGEYGKVLTSLQLPIDLRPDAVGIFQKQALEDCPPLYDMFFHQIPEEICTRVEERIPLGKGYSMGFVCRGGIFGSVVIKMRKGTELKNRETIEAFIHQAAVALLRRNARRELQESQEKNVRNMEFLSRTAMAFIEMGDDEDVFKYIAEQVHSLVPGSIVGVNSYDPVTRALTLRTVTGDREDLVAFEGGLGRPLTGAVFPIDVRPDAVEVFSRKTLLEGPPLYDMFYRTIPEERCTAVEESMGRGTNYVMGFACRGEIFGNVGINVKKGTELENRETIEAFIHQAAVALLRRSARLFPGS